jgi:PKD domain/K319L-like, PKD domain
MFRPTRRAAVLPLTAAILLGSAGSALAIPNTDPTQPPPPPPNQAPTAALAVTPNPGLVSNLLPATAISAKVPGLDTLLGRNAISFDASGSSDPDGSIAKYLWDLDGNGSFEKTTTTPRTSRSYTAPGDFAVKVRVVDNANASATATQTLKIHRAPVAKIGAAPQNVTVGQKATLSAAGSSDDNGIARYDWDLDGNGTYETPSGTSQTVQAPFSSVGAKTVGVRVTDIYNATSAATTTVTVHPAPVAAFNAAPKPAVVGEQVRFDGTASIRTEPISKFEWDLDGNGTFETVTGARPVATRSYGSAGTLTTRLRITDAQGSQSVQTQQLTVLATAPRDTVAPIMRVGAVSSRLSRTGRVTLDVTCPAGERLCTGRVSVTSKGRSAGARQFRLAGGQRSQVRVLLSSSARRTVRNRHRLTVRITATARDAAGNQGVSPRSDAPTQEWSPSVS